MAKKDTVVIGEEVEVQTGGDKKKQLNKKSLLVMGVLLGVIIVIAFVGTSGSGSGESRLAAGYKGESLDPQFVDRDVWRDKTQEKASEMSDTLKAIQESVDSVKQGRATQVELMNEVLSKTKETSRQINDIVADMKDMKSRYNSKFREMQEDIEARPVFVGQGGSGGEMRIGAGDDNSVRSKPLVAKIPLPGESANNSKPASGFNMPELQGAQEAAGGIKNPPPKNPFASIKLPATTKSVTKEAPTPVPTAVEEKVMVEAEPVSEGMMISGMTQEEANTYQKMKVKASRKLIETEFAGYLPEGSFAKVSIISGLDAGASSKTQKNPQPIMMRVQSDAIIPAMQGKQKYKLKGCFLVGSAFGEISTERVQIQPTRLSCVDAERQYVLSAKIDAAVLDFDNVLGLRGTVEYRDGARLAKSIIATSAGSLAQLAGVAGGVATSTVSTGISSATTGDTSQLLELPSLGDLGSAVGVSAFGSSAEIIAKRYADQMAEIYPVINLPGGRTGSVMFLSGVNLKWKRYGTLYEEEVTPDDGAVPEVVRGGILAR